MKQLLKMAVNPMKAFRNFNRCLVAIIIPFIFTGCEKEKPISKDFLVDSIDIFEMAKKHLPEFNLTRKGPKWIVYEYVFDDTASARVRIQTMICHSESETDSMLTLYLNDMAGVPNEGPFYNQSVGTKFLWMADAGVDYPSNVIFVRENAILIFYQINYTQLIPLAKNIDFDLLHKASYIIYDDD